MTPEPCPIECFWVDGTGTGQIWLRRFTYLGEPDCPAGGHHQASVMVTAVEQLHPDPEGYIHEIDPGLYPDEADWPTRCNCGQPFPDTAERRVDQRHLYRRLSTGETWPIDDLPPGAMFNAWWLPDTWKGADGIGLVVITPDRRQHHNDMRAANCTRKEDDPDYTRHKCWVRHGDVHADPAVITVDKNGETCAAGAGSILTPEWHGFIRDGHLVL